MGRQISGLCDGAKAYLAARDGASWKLIITYDEARARALAEDIDCFTQNVYLYPARDLLFFNADIRGNVISGERIDVWRHMATDPEGVVVTTIDAFLDRIEAPDLFKKKLIEIDATDRLDLDALVEKLAVFGYERASQVSTPGLFAVRGGIIDVWPLTEEIPIRIELWDDEINQMKAFDPESQRSVEDVDHVKIYPASEIEEGEVSFLEYWHGDNQWLFVDEPARCRERIKAVTGENVSGALAENPSEAEEHNAAADCCGLGAETCNGVSKELFEALAVMPNLTYMTGLDQKVPEAEENFTIRTKDTAAYTGAFEMLIEDLKRYSASGYRITLLSASQTRVFRIAESFREYGIVAVADGEPAGKLPEKTGMVMCRFGNLHKGFELTDEHYVIISETDIYGARKRKHRKKRFDYEGDNISSLAELHVGDYIVHEEHGLGIYRGIEKIEQNGVVKDYIKIEYQGGDNCYIPATKLDIIQKYASAEGKRPKLNKLGGDQWAKTKAKVKKGVEEIAGELVTLYSSRLNGRGYVYGPDTVWQKEFEELFEFEETEDQIRAIEDVKHDMETGKIMDRLVCGDVGYGKTEVALRAAFKVIQEGKQVIYLVPTTILAQQHYNTFVKRMANFPVRVDLLSRFRTPAQQKKSLEDFSKGLVDVIIGTHRVLSKDIEPKALGLIIVDEEQRFGVKHKEALKQLKRDVDVLTLTATPIPRTLHMSLAGIRDLSVLEEPPQDRQPIQTYVMEYDEAVVREAIRRELARGGQVYYVYNRVNSIIEMTSKIQALIPGAVVAFAHGQMPEKELEEVMLDFINGEIDVLVTTTIIETGLDIQNVNTMIVHDADRLGLSQLYQLRGRVGRSNRTAYAFLLYKKDKVLNEEAEKRLKAIREFTELGSGIKIAMRDLEIRGAGNVLGAEQSGHMEAVGYDLYCKLLNTAVKALKGEDITRSEYDTSVEVDTDAYIPSTYIRNEEQKLDIYKRIASITTEEDYLDMQDELLDRFGDMPKAVNNLLLVARIKSLAHSVFVTEVVIERNAVKLTMYKRARIDPEKIPELVEEYEGRLKVITGEKVSFELMVKEKTLTCDIALEEAVKLLERMNEMVRARY